MLDAYPVGYIRQFSDFRNRSPGGRTSLSGVGRAMPSCFASSRCPRPSRTSSAGGRSDGWGLGLLDAPAAVVTGLRVMTYNILLGGRRGQPVRDVVRAVAPDVLLVNETRNGPFSSAVTVGTSPAAAPAVVSGGRPAGPTCSQSHRHQHE